jgi:hypothetical protein
MEINRSGYISRSSYVAICAFAEWRAASITVLNCTPALSLRSELKRRFRYEACASDQGRTLRDLPKIKPVTASRNSDGCNRVFE